MAELIDYRVSYGECVGYCSSTLTISGSEIGLVQASNAGGPPRRFRGEIDPDLEARIAERVASLDPERLHSIYGTPDARDEGAVTFRLRGPGGTTAHSCSRGAPPDELATLDALLSPILSGWIDGEAPAGAHFDQVP